MLLHVPINEMYFNFMKIRWITAVRKYFHLFQHKICITFETIALFWKSNSFIECLFTFHWNQSQKKTEHKISVQIKWMITCCSSLTLLQIYSKINIFSCTRNLNAISGHGFVYCQLCICHEWEYWKLSFCRKHLIEMNWVLIFSLPKKKKRIKTNSNQAQQIPTAPLFTLIDSYRTPHALQSLLFFTYQFTEHWIARIHAFYTAVLLWTTAAWMHWHCAQKDQQQQKNTKRSEWNSLTVVVSFN